MTERKLSLVVNGEKVFEYVRRPDQLNPADVGFLITDREPGAKSSLLVKKYNIK